MYLSIGYQINLLKKETIFCCKIYDLVSKYILYFFDINSSLFVAKLYVCDISNFIDNCYMWNTIFSGLKD
jgi:hypothetical protein